MLFGGTSEIGLAVLTRLTGPRLRRVVLAGRPSPELDRAADMISRSGVPEVTITVYDASDANPPAQLVRDAFAAGDIDVVVMAIGSGPAPAPAEPNVTALQLSLRNNLVGPAQAGLLVATELRRQGHGALVFFTGSEVISPTTDPQLAAGSGQAGLTAFAISLSDWLRGSGARIILVRLGVVPTKYWHDALPSRPRPNADTTDVANAVAAEIRSGRQKIVYVPGSLRAKWLRARLGFH